MPCSFLQERPVYPPPSHEHSFESSWSVDDTYHWYKATCEHTDVVKDKAEHSKDSGLVTKEPSISEDGEKVFSCSVCGKELEKVVLPGGIEVGGGKSLESLLKENDLESATHLKIKGTLSEADFKTLREMTTLETLDISNVDNEEIPNKAFLEASFPHILLPKNLKNIGERAFQGSSITEMILPEGLKTIGNAAFMGAKNLSKLSIPGSVKYVGRWIVQQALGGWVDDIPVDAALLELSLGEGIKELAPSAFWGSTVKEVRIPNSIKEIPDWCFGQSYLEKVVLHDGLTRIGAWAFENCKLVFDDNRLVIPKEVKVIGPFAFYLHIDVHSSTTRNTVILNDGLEALYQDAFVLGFHNETLEIPASLKKLYRGSLIFEGGLTSVVFKGTTPPAYLKNIDPNAISYNETTGEYEGPEDGNPPAINIPAPAEKYKNIKAYVPSEALDLYKSALKSDTDFEPFAESNIMAME